MTSETTKRRDLGQDPSIERGRIPPAGRRAIAHSNIALAKYWGKRDIEHNLPDVPSLSLTLDALTTRTLVRFDPRTEKFQTWIIPAGGGVVRNMMTTRDGNLALAESGVNRVALVEIKKGT